jgi:hypothetical protein
VLDGESVKIISVYTVLSAGQPERSQITFFDPSKDRHFAYAAMSGDSTGSKILGVVIFHRSQFNTPLRDIVIQLTVYRLNDCSVFILVSLVNRKITKHNKNNTKKSQKEKR